MCTLGGISAPDDRGEPQAFLLKTLDAVPAPYEIGLAYPPGGIPHAYYRLSRQGGVNAGVNLAGLAILISYSDYRDRERRGRMRATSWTDIANDLRTGFNEELLKGCRTVEQALDRFSRFVPKHPEMMGGNHLLADRNGALAVLEHCEGRYRVERLARGGVVARANNSLLLIAKLQRKIPIIGDSLSRMQTMERFLEAELKRGPSALGVSRFLDVARRILGFHGANGSKAAGTVCAHGLRLPGARASATGPDGVKPMWTLSGIVLDPARAALYFTTGTPCSAKWRRLTVYSEESGSSVRRPTGNRASRSVISTPDLFSAGARPGLSQNDVLDR